MDRRSFVGASIAFAGLLGSRLSPLAVPTLAGRPAAYTDRRGGPEPDALAYALVLGSAQDGGAPQAGCYTASCDRARAAEPPPLVASLAAVTRDGAGAAPRFYLVDASPDLPRQMDLIAAREPLFRERSAARRPFDGIFLTHAHMGHYLGLAHLGREALAVAPTPVHCTRRMAEFLASNAPWSLLVDEGRLVPRPLEPGERRSIDGALGARCVRVPHRDEFSDTVAWVFEGPGRSLLYLPDIDRWDRWELDVAEVVASVDVAFLDGSFYSADEVPGRNIEDIPHPLIADSMERLRYVVDGTRVVFTHLNNTNPALEPASPQAAAVRDAGFEIAREGMRVEL